MGEAISERGEERGKKRGRWEGSESFSSFLSPLFASLFFSPETPDTEANVLPPSYATFTPFRSTFLCNKPDEDVTKHKRMINWEMRGGWRVGGERGVYRVLFLEDICLCDSVNQFKV